MVQRQKNDGTYEEVFPPQTATVDKAAYVDLPVGVVITLTASSDVAGGYAQQLDMQTGAVQRTVAVVAGPQVFIGPFSTAQRYLVACSSGSIGVVIARAADTAARSAADSAGNVTGLFTQSGFVPLRGGAHTSVHVGDSLTNQEAPTASGANLQWLANAAFHNLNYRLGLRLNMVAISGVSGTRSDQILLRLQEVLAANPGVGNVFITSGANDVDQYLTAPRTPAQYKATMQAMINMCLAAGARPIVFGITGSEQYITTSGKADMWQTCNWILRDLARLNPDMVLEPVDTYLTDLSKNFPSNFTSLTDGSFHWNSLGAKVISDALYPTLNAMIPPVDLFPSARPSGSTWAPTNELAFTPNSLMTGSQAASGNMTGVLPAAGITISIGGTGTGVASLSQNTDAPTGSQWSSIAYTGPASAVNATDYVNVNTANVSLAAAGLAVGDTVQGLFEFNMGASATNLMGAEIFVNFIGATGSVTPMFGPPGAYSRSYGMKQNNGAAPLVALGSNPLGKGVLHTVPMPIPAGTTALALFVRVYPVSGSNAATFTPMFGRHRIRKV